MTAIRIGLSGTKMFYNLREIFRFEDIIMANTTILHFTGIGSAFNAPLGNTNAYFINGTTLVMFDCGESVYPRIIRLLKSKRIRRLVILITHLHSDHIGSLGTVLSFCDHIVPKPVDIFYPTKALERFLRCIGIGDDKYTHYLSAPYAWDLTIVPHRVVHSDMIACFGYEVVFGTASFYYSGDAHDIPDIVLKKFLDNKIELLFHEATLDKNAAGHCCYTTLERKIPLSERSRVYCMHLGNDKLIALLRKRGFQIPNIEVP